MKRSTKDHSDVKLSCRNVWKIYGRQPEQFFEGTQGRFADAAQHADVIRDADHIVANADVSFDVHAGEIFVIMGLSGSGKSAAVFGLVLGINNLVAIQLYKSKARSE